MEYRSLGDSGLKVSPVCLGAMHFGGRTSAATAAKIVGAARDAGVNFIDTAESYAMGASESILAKLIRRDRADWVLASKLGSHPVGDGPNQRGLSRSWMMNAIDASLKRLGTDYLDVYYLHRADPTTPLAETIGTLGDLIRAGKVRYWGFSNFRAWKIAEMVALCAELGVPAPIVAQPYYNAVYRVTEFEYLPACEAYGIGVVPYSPLASGLLTGRYDSADALAASARVSRETESYGTAYTRDALKIAPKIKRRAEAQGMTAGQMALNWVLNNAVCDSVVAGPRTLSHWTAHLGALKHPFTAADEAFFDELAPPCYPLVVGYHDRKDPPQGRWPRTG